MCPAPKSEEEKKKEKEEEDRKKQEEADRKAELKADEQRKKDKVLTVHDHMNTLTHTGL